MKRQLVIVLSMFMWTLSFGQNGLSTEDKIEDFEYLYQTLKDNYPYFEAEVRMNGFNWLDKKEDYIIRLKETENDSLYFLELKKIVDEMNSGHTDFGPTEYVSYMLNAYKKMDSIKYEAWINELEKSKSKADYWNGFNEIGKEKTLNTGEEKLTNCTDSIINNQIALINIRTFDFNTINDDFIKIDSFLKKITRNQISNLIINIQGNGGGSAKYWQRNLVSRLTNDTIFNYTYPTIKKGDFNQSFYPNFFKNAEKLTNDYNNGFFNIPHEAIENDYYIQTWTQKIAPFEPINFSGHIFLLVDHKVFSSSEAFAQFCKTSGWAKIIGERTNGDGVGSDPGIVTLPKSGLSFRYPVIGGLNYDGSFNYEEKTVPDIIIEAKTSKERLEKAIRFIVENQ